MRSWDGRHVDSTPRNDGRGLQGACRWVQPSTAAAVTLAAIAANVWSSATTRGKIRSLKRTDIASLFSLISEAGPGCEIRSESRVLPLCVQSPPMALAPDAPLYLNVREAVQR